MRDTMTICTEALQVVESGAMIFRHISNMGTMMVYLDTGFTQLRAEGPDRIHAAAFAIKLAM